MDIEVVRGALLWCAIINFLILLLWAGMFILARDWMYRFHGRWVRLSGEQYDMIHFSGMALYKIAIILFNLVPWIALHLAG